MECWNWRGPLHPNGYGVASKPYSYAHRKAFVVSGGKLIDGLVVMHLCDNTKCCNPAHLRQGTYRENIHDAIRKGRRKGQCFASNEEARKARARRLYEDPERHERRKAYWRDYYHRKGKAARQKRRDAKV